MKRFLSDDIGWNLINFAAKPSTSSGQEEKLVVRRAHHPERSRRKIVPSINSEQAAVRLRRLRRGFGEQAPPFRIFAGLRLVEVASATQTEGIPRRLRRRNAFGLIQEYCTKY
ncbi:MAG: hypothetical protein Q8P97_01700 [bacterium]|nr:hypothetical protein [bacterium]